MNVLISKGLPCGKIEAPPSKSMAHRLLICSYLAGGGTVSNLAQSEDIKATKACIDALKTGGELNCNESGSTLRFMAAICLLQNEKLTLRGTKRLFSRSLTVYEDICKEQNIYFEQGEDYLTLKGRLSPGKYKVRGDISSQFISGLMFVLPLLEDDSEIEITGKIESRPYLDLTLDALSAFGIKEQFEDNIIKIKGNQKYIAKDVTVEGDYSNAAFFDAFSVLGANVEVTGLNPHSLQGDKIYKQYFELVKNGCPTLDITDCPDLAPVLMAVAAAKNGCRLIGTRRLKIKESDRGEAMKTELAKMGVSVTNLENEIIVEKCGNLKRSTLYGHNDHRIVMALSVLCTLTGGIIEGAEAVSKSFPDFFDAIESLAIEVKKYEA